ncbi:MAG: hypothetical protein IJM02_04820 [Clostridia bacterium]|nr:hypothetical protein [Clostridia bacterium]
MNIKSLKLLPSILVLAVSAPVAVLLRCTHYFGLLEAHTGFFAETGFKVILFYAVLLAAVLFFYISVFVNRKIYSFDSAVAKRPVSAIASIICGIGCFISVYGEYTAKDVDSSAYTVSSALTSSSVGPVLTYVICVLGLISAVWFLVLGITLLTGRSNGSAYRLLALAPVLWCIVRLVLRFTRTVSYLKVSDLFLEMMALAAYCIFFMAYARCSSGINAETSPKQIVSFGFIGALLGFVCFIPRAVAALSGRADFIFILSRADLSDFTIALFMLASIFTRIVRYGTVIAQDGTPAK